MRTEQPNWKLIGQLGDASPMEYGGYFIFEDTTGQYPPEAELLCIYDDGSEAIGAQVYRFCLDQCTYVNGVLSDNEFHPDYPAWFAQPEDRRRERPQDTTYLRNLARFEGRETGDLISLFTSDNPLLRAMAYRAVGEFHGFDNLDSYPLTLTMEEVRERYSGDKYQQ
jgi:hypothetical protein